MLRLVFHSLVLQMGSRSTNFVLFVEPRVLIRCCAKSDLISAIGKSRSFADELFVRLRINMLKITLCKAPASLIS